LAVLKSSKNWFGWLAGTNAVLLVLPVPPPPPPLLPPPPLPPPGAGSTVPGPVGAERAGPPVIQPTASTIRSVGVPLFAKYLRHAVPSVSDNSTAAMFDRSAFGQVFTVEAIGIVSSHGHTVT
jgi:hypothetical protein